MNKQAQLPNTSEKLDLRVVCFTFADRKTEKILCKNWQ